MKINKVASMFNLPSETLRYWEKIGIISKVKRDASGYRDYSQADIDWIRYIKCIREIGIPIAKIQEYTELSREGEHFEIRKNILKHQKAQLQLKIEEIEQALALVDYKIDNYDALAVHQQRQ